jgi:hypothetical protein
MLHYDTCQTCGLTAEISGAWVKGNFSGETISGLNPQNCSGCWDLMQQNGAVSWARTADGNLVSAPRPTAADQSALDT